MTADDLPDDLYVDHGGQSLVLDPDRVAAYVDQVKRNTIEACAGLATDRMYHSGLEIAEAMRSLKER